MNSPASLPRDTDALQAMILAQQSLLAERDAEIEHLKLVIAKLRRLQFGQRSEKIDEMLGQLELSLEELEATRAERTVTPATVPPKEVGRQPVRKPLPDHLPRETVVHEPEPACCPDCGGHLKSLGEDVSEVLDYIPASFKVIRHVRPKLACGRCDTIVQAPAVSRPIARGMAGPGLLAHVLVAKYADHLPLYRQSGIYAREGVDLERSTLADWVGQCAALLRPLVNHLQQHVLGGTKIHADDTPVPVLAPGEGKTKTGRLWTYVRDDRPAGDASAPAVWFAYSPNRQGGHPQGHLKSFQGILQADAFAGFDALYARGDIIEAACWAHARRKFFEIHQAQGSPIATEALKRIAALYAIEAELRGKPPDVRQQGRARAKPILDAFHVWLLATRRQLSQKSGLANAIGYALNHWQALIRYVSDGRIEIDNNAAERALRAVALGRKNFLFAGSDAGGERAAALYSLIGSARLNGLDPEAFLRFVIARIADYPVNRVSDLLPWNVAAQIAQSANQSSPT